MPNPKGPWSRSWSPVDKSSPYKTCEGKRSSILVGLSSWLSTFLENHPIFCLRITDWSGLKGNRCALWFHGPEDISWLEMAFSVSVHWERFFFKTRKKKKKRQFWTQCGVTVIFIYSRLEKSLWGRCRKRERERERERIYHLMDFWSFAITFIFLLRRLRCALILTDK